MASIQPVHQGTTFDPECGHVQFDEDNNPVGAFEDSTIITFYGFPNPTLKVWTEEELEKNQADDPFLWLGLRINGEDGSRTSASVTLNTIADDSIGYNSAGKEFPAESVLVISSGPLLRWWHLTLSPDNPVITEGAKKIHVQLGLDGEPAVYRLTLEEIPNAAGKYRFNSLQVVIYNPDEPIFAHSDAAPDTNYTELFEGLGLI